MEIKSKSIFEEPRTEDGFRICVMRFVRDYYEYDLWLRELAPSVELLNDWRERRITWEEYKQRYLEEMKERDYVVMQLIESIKDKKVVTLLCAERDDRRCHRRLLIESLLYKLPPYNSNN